MHILTCKQCGKTFEAPTRAYRYCKGGCVAAYESAEAQKRYRNYSPARRKAVMAVARALQNGELARHPCEVCGSNSVIAHHDDYAAPLDVRWLCQSHHRQHHLQHGPGKNA